MKNKKGFTLVELLAVIVILGVIITLAVNGTGPIAKFFGNGYYKSIEGTAKIAAQDYFTDNALDKPAMIIGINSGYSFNDEGIAKMDSSISDNLSSLGYLEQDIVDQDGEKCSGYVTATKTSKDKKYTYDVCLNCNNKYNTEDCNSSFDDELIVPDDYYYQWSDDETDGPVIVNAKKGSVEVLPEKIYIVNNNEVIFQTSLIDGKAILKELNNNKGDKKVDKYLEENPDLYIRLQYDEKGNFNKSDTTTDIIPRSDENITIASPIINLYSNESANAFVQYSSGNNFITYDYKSDSIVAKFSVNENEYKLNSDDRFLCYEEDNVNPTICGDSKTYSPGEAAISKTVNVSLLTKLGESEKVPFLIKIDNIKPSVSFTYDGTSGSNDWYISPVDVTMDLTSGPSGVKEISYCVFSPSDTDSCTPNTSASISNNHSIISVNRVASTSEYGNERNYGRKICAKVKSGSGVIGTYCNAENIRIDDIRPNAPTVITDPVAVYEDEHYKVSSDSTIFIKPQWEDNTVSGLDYYRYDNGPNSSYALSFLKAVEGKSLNKYPGYDFPVSGLTLTQANMLFVYAVYSKAGNAWDNYVGMNITKENPKNPVIVASTINSKKDVFNNDWVAENVNVKLTSDNASIYYCKTKGCVPTNSSTLYNGSFVLSNEGANYINAIAYNADLSSEVTSFVVYIDKTSPSAPTIKGNLNSQETIDVNFTLTSGTDSGSGVYKTEYSYDNLSWKTYSSGVTMLSTTGYKTVSARTCDRVGNCSSIVQANGICNKDAVNIGAPIDYGTSGYEFYDTFLFSNKNGSLIGTTDSKYEWAYWKATSTTDTSNNKSSQVSSICGSSPSSSYIKTTSDAKATIWLKYKKQYYCFAVRPYRSTDISGINRWTVQYKHAITGNRVDGKKYNGN